MTKPNKYESYRTKDIRGVAFTSIAILKMNKSLNPINPAKSVESKWQENIINNTS
jgi:hypothetical protein